MTRICVIGNSHVGAIKLGWTEVESSYPDIVLTFFAAPERHTKGLTPRDGLLVAETEALADQLAFTSGGCREINPDHYDIFLLYGMISLPGMFSRYKSISRAFLREFTLETARSSLLAAQAQKLRQVTNKSVYISIPPVPTHNSDEPPKLMPRNTETVALLQSEVFSNLNCVLVPQPKETLVEGRSTFKRFSTGSMRLETVTEVGEQHHLDEDNHHMNASYGRLWLERFLANLQDTVANAPVGRVAVARI